MRPGGKWLRAAIVLGVLGATVGVSLDAIHTHFGTGTHPQTGVPATTWYPDPWIFRMAWWVPPLFASAAIAIGLGRPLWERILDRRTPPPPVAAVAASMGLFMLAYLLSGVLPFSWSTRALVLAVIAAATWSGFDRTPLGVFLALATAAVGTSVEIALVRAGLFFYLEPDVAGVPGWLPWLYVSAAVGVGNLGKRLVDA